MREHVWIIDGHPIAVRLKDGTPQVAHELPDPMRPADEGWHDFGGAHTLEDDFAIEILCLAEENDRHIAHIAALEAHLGGIRKLLRSECADLGDNDWSDNLHLADVVEKHLVRHVRSRVEDLEAENRWLGSILQQDERVREMRKLRFDNKRLEAAVLAHARAADEASQSKRGAVIGARAQSRDAERARVRREFLAEIEDAAETNVQQALSVDDIREALDRICPEG